MNKNGCFEMAPLDKVSVEIERNVNTICCCNNAFCKQANNCSVLHIIFWLLQRVGTLKEWLFRNGANAKSHCRYSKEYYK